MKKKLGVLLIIISICLISVLSFLIYCICENIASNKSSSDIFLNPSKFFVQLMVRYSIFAFLTLLALFATFMISYYVFRADLHALFASTRESRIDRKAEKKQAKIEKLENKINDIKKE